VAATDGRAPAAAPDRAGRRLVSLALLVGGIAVIVGATLAGEGGALEAIVSPPPIVRAALVGTMTVLGLALGRRAFARIAESGATEGGLRGADPVALLRGIRLVFLSLAAVAAAAGWLLASPLPLVVAGIVAAVDVVETSFLLLVVGPRRHE
jgi:hypothetical protein